MRALLHCQRVCSLQVSNVSSKDVILLSGCILHSYYFFVYYNTISSGEMTDIKIERGVRCILSPTLFNACVDIIFREALTNRLKGVKIGGDIC